MCKHKIYYDVELNSDGWISIMLCYINYHQIFFQAARTGDLELFRRDLELSQTVIGKFLDSF